MTRSSARGRFLFAALAVAAAAVCVRLGFWQLGRLSEVRDARAVRETRLALPPLALSDVLGRGESSPAPDEWRRVSVSGTWDYTGEVLIRSRTLNGRPGVHVVTPLRVKLVGASDDSARIDDADRTADPHGAEILVLRGWLPAPDAMNPGTIPTSEPGPSAGAVGVLRSSRDGAGLPILAAGEGDDRRPTLAAIDVGAIRDSTARGPMGDNPPGGIKERYFLQLLPPDGGESATAPFPVPLPPADDGPHLGYAIQWFSFALVALVGSAAFLHHARRQRSVNP